MNRKSTRLCFLAAAAASVSCVAAGNADAATWTPFVIRQANVQPAVTPVVITGTTDGSAVSTQIDEAGEKTAYGTSDFDGQPLSNVTGINYNRVDAGVPDPYLNIWVSDGTNYALIAPVTNMMSGGGYTSNDVNGQNLQTLGFNIYEYTSANFDWLVPGATRQAQGLMHSDGTPVLVSEIGGLVIDDPNPTLAQGGTGAPKLGTGLNVVFGDTQGNFVNPMPYTLTNVNVVPEPSTFALGAIAGGGLLLRRRRRAAKQA
jgi:hypothetical protein